MTDREARLEARLDSIEKTLADLRRLVGVIIESLEDAGIALR